MKERKTPYVSVNLTKPARDTLRQTTLDLTTPAGRRISMSDTLIAGLQIANTHRNELLAALKDPS